MLQAIGAAGLITLVFIRKGPIIRFTAGLVLLAAYQFMLDNFWFPQVMSSAQGGLMGTLSWGGLLLLSTVLADLFHREKGYKVYFGAASASVFSAGLILALFFALSKHRVSKSYVFISVGISALVLFAFNALFALTDMRLSLRPRLRMGLLQMWGRNPLLLYLIHMILLGVTFVPGSEIWYAGAPWWSAVLQTAAFFTVLCVIAWKLDSKKVYLKI